LIQPARRAHHHVDAEPGDPPDVLDGCRGDGEFDRDVNPIEVLARDAGEIVIVVLVELKRDGKTVLARFIKAFSYQLSAISFAGLC
jgi:hypothetical protein